MAISIDEHLERGREALAKLENADAVAAFESALASAKTPAQRAFALTGLAIVCIRSEDNERALDLLDQAIAACLSQPNGDGRIARALAEAWDEKAILLIILNKDEEALEVLDALLRRFLDRVTDAVPRDEDARALRHVTIRALSTKGTVLDSLDRLQEAVDCNEELIRRFEAVEDRAVRRRVARAIARRAWLFGHLGRQDKEIAGYDELVARFGEVDDPDITETILGALESKLRIYRDQEDLGMVIEICDQVIRRYGADTDFLTAATVARMRVRRAVALGKRGEHGRELAEYDDVVRLYGDSPEWMLRVHAAKALMFKAVTLNDADQTAAEIECYDEVVRRYGEDAGDEVRVVAADALIHKGLSLGAIAEDAAQDTGVREIEPEIACYDEAVARYGDEPSIHFKRAVAEALLHKSETLMEAGHAGEASICLDSLIGGYASIDDEELREIVSDARALKAEM